MAADGDINIQPDIPVYHRTEGSRIGRAVFIAHDFLCINIVNTLILRRFPPEGKPDSEIFQRIYVWCFLLNHRKTEGSLEVS